MNIHHNDYCLKNDRLIRFTEKPGNIDYFSPIVQGTKSAIAKEIVQNCYKDDPVYVRQHLKGLLKDVQTDISTDDNGLRSVQFSKNGELLEGFSLGEHDDVETESLLRLFGDGLIKQMIEKSRFRNIEPDCIPCAIVKDGDAYIGTYISPKYLTKEELTDEGKEVFHSNTAKEYLSRFEAFVENPVIYGYEEYNMDGEKLSEKDGFYGSDPATNGMGIEVERFLGNHVNVKDAVQTVLNGIPLDAELTRVQEKADEQGGKKQEKKKEVENEDISFTKGRSLPSFVGG